MNAGGHAGGQSDRDPDRLEGLGAFIWQRRERVRAAAHRGQARGGRDNVVECRLRGASMADAIPQGSRIRIGIGVDGTPHRVGDIVAFMDGERVVVHRIVRRAGGHLLTRGDAMLLPDPPLDAAAVLGDVIEIDSGSGWRPPGAQSRPPRRDRLLALAVLTTSSLLLRADLRLARRFIEWLAAADHRHAWIRRLLY